MSYPFSMHSLRFGHRMEPLPMNTRDAVIQARDHLYHAAFVHFGLVYARLTTKTIRTLIETMVLALCVLSASVLVYVHVAFVRTHVHCLDGVHRWPQNGILRVEVIPGEWTRNYSLVDSYLKESRMKNTCEEGGVDFFMDEYPPETAEVVRERAQGDPCILEYALEYGLLKLSAQQRSHFEIPVEFVTLDKDDTCFGNDLSKFLLNTFVGYDDALLSSLKNFADREDYKGYVRNVVTGDDYIFVNVWMTERSYISAGFMMILFTIVISILLRYSHHQIFLFIVELLHMLELHASVRFQVAPLITVVLALVGMEAVMAEFFGDTTLAFFVIVTVWCADQYDSVWCRTHASKRHWARFFYLYHFAFYAYSYQFNGHYGRLALVTSSLFILHSMLFFLHRYEIPALLRIRGRPPTPHPAPPPPPPPAAPLQRTEEPQQGAAAGATTSDGERRRCVGPPKASPPSQGAR